MLELVFMLNTRVRALRFFIYLRHARRPFILQRHIRVVVAYY